MIEIAQVETPEQIAQARGLLVEYLTFIRTEVDNALSDPDDAPPMTGIEDELAALPGIFSLPDGRLLLALADGTPVGCIALRQIDKQTGELKRLWVCPAARSLGAGRLLVGTLIAEARQAGYTRLLLSTVDKLREAQRLYTSFGFEATDPFWDGPPEIMAHEIFLRLDL
ncbi:MAG TPA: GNAT family N-acetyltransferase [Candidatus Limnocylindrales bacterium]|nr:GNAT family N-acetyltransferase [Candidatus Limnocylindrales bacterium]